MPPKTSRLPQIFGTRRNSIPQGIPPIIACHDEKSQPHKDLYHRAKHGDASTDQTTEAAMTAGLDYADKVITQEVVDSLKAIASTYPNGKKPIITPIVGAEKQDGSINVLPVAYAKTLANKTGLPFEFSVTQEASAGRTGSTRKGRFFKQAKFRSFHGNSNPDNTEGIRQGKSYIVVDDNATMCGTLQNASDYIMQQGGQIAGFSTISRHKDTQRLQVERSDLDGLNKRWQTKKRNDFISLHNELTGTNIPAGKQLDPNDIRLSQPEFAAITRGRVDKFRNELLKEYNDNYLSSTPAQQQQPAPTATALPITSRERLINALSSITGYHAFSTPAARAQEQEQTDAETSYNTTTTNPPQETGQPRARSFLDVLKGKKLPPANHLKQPPPAPPSTEQAVQTAVPIESGITMTQEQHEPIATLAGTVNIVPDEAAQLATSQQPSNTTTTQDERKPAAIARATQTEATVNGQAPISQAEAVASLVLAEENSQQGASQSSQVASAASGQNNEAQPDRPLTYAQIANPNIKKTAPKLTKQESAGSIKSNHSASTINSIMSAASAVVNRVLHPRGGNRPAHVKHDSLQTSTTSASTESGDTQPLLQTVHSSMQLDTIQSERSASASGQSQSTEQAQQATAQAHNNTRWQQRYQSNSNESNRGNRRRRPQRYQRQNTRPLQENSRWARDNEDDNSSRGFNNRNNSNGRY